MTNEECGVNYKQFVYNNKVCFIDHNTAIAYDHAVLGERDDTKFMVCSGIPPRANDSVRYIKLLIAEHNKCSSMRDDDYYRIISSAIQVGDDRVINWTHKRLSRCYDLVTDMRYALMSIEQGLDDVGKYFISKLDNTPNISKLLLNTAVACASKWCVEYLLANRVFERISLVAVTILCTNPPHSCMAPDPGRATTLMEIRACIYAAIHKNDQFRDHITGGRGMWLR